MKIVVVGSANTDLVVETPRIPVPGETVLGGDLQTVPGGKGANQAVAAVRLGAEVAFIARVGEDGFGASALEGYHREGMDTRFVLATPGVASGVALIAVREDTGENAILVAPGANSRLTAADIEAAAPAFDMAKAVVVSLEIPLDAVIAAVEIGHRRGIPVLLNPAPARSLPPELLAKVSLLIPNETEAMQLLERTPNENLPVETLAGELLASGVGAVALTRGASGVLLATPEALEIIPAFPVTAVDTVAAGDCFTGAVAVKLAEGASLSDACRFASAAAALKVTRRGAQPGLPTRAAVEAFLQSRS